MTYISRELAIKEIMCLPNCPNGYSDTYDKARIIVALEEVPPADVVKIVRCGVCQFYDRHDHRCKVFNHGVNTIHFCSYGRKVRR